MEKRKPERRDRTAAHRPAVGGRKRAVLGAIQKNRDKREPNERLEFTHFSPSRGSEAAQAEILTPIGWQRTLCYRDAWLRDFQTAIA